MAAYVAGSLVLGGGVVAEMAMIRARLLAAWAGLLISAGAVLGLVFDVVIHSLHCCLRGSPACPTRTWVDGLRALDRQRRGAPTTRPDSVRDGQACYS